MSASLLSPLAKPFHPIMGEIVHPVIYNDGIPSLTYLGSKHEFLENITDETLDEVFPPTAEEAAELEAAESFVYLMMKLAVLEEKEEAARSLHGGIKKRWEARRVLAGKPRSARHSVEQVQHKGRRSIHTRDLVSFHNSPEDQEESRMRAKVQGIPAAKKHKYGARFQWKKPIQQPRKNS